MNSQHELTLHHATPHDLTGTSKGTPTPPLKPPTPHAFAACEGDGGLVKGVLAHMAALANTENWLSSPSPSASEE